MPRAKTALPDAGQRELQAAIDVDCDGGSAAVGERLQLRDGVLGGALAGAIASAARSNSKRPMWPSSGLMVTSGGSPARRARVIRSCVMLSDATMTLNRLGALRSRVSCCQTVPLRP